MAQSYNIDGHVWLHESFMSRVNRSERPGKPLMHTACTQQYFYMYLRQANIEYDDNLRRRFFIFSCCVTRWRGGEEKKKKQDENKMLQQLPQIHNSLHQVSNWIARKRARERERELPSAPRRDVSPVARVGVDAAADATSTSCCGDETTVSPLWDSSCGINTL